MNVIIVGDGSAGIISAIMLKHKIPHANVTIIKSSKINVIGVGESTTGTFTGMLDIHMGININDFVKKVNPVSKYGTLFKFGDSDFYYAMDSIFDKHDPKKDFPEGFYMKGANYGSTELSQLMINKQGIEFNENTLGLQLDNEKFLNYMNEHAKNIGINFITDTIDTVEREGNNIKSLNKKYFADIFIDCSGYNAVLSNEEWVDYSDYLINDRSFLFQTPLKGRVRPYTTATTMDSGWLWELDHFTHTVNGYVYSSKYSTEDEIKNELENHFKIKIKEHRVVKFTTGQRKKHWVGNCITIGNSDIFLEPLEATSLMVITRLINDMIDILRFGDKCGDLKDRYNIFTDKMFKNIRDFIFIHFCFNTKKDTKYWKDYNNRYTMIDDNSFCNDMIQYHLINDAHVKFVPLVTDEINPYQFEGWINLFRGLNVRKFYEDRNKI